jgi:hypothetical protein
MTETRKLLVSGWLVVGCAAGLLSAAPVPKEKQMLKCELTVTGKTGDSSPPDAGEVVITNTSKEVVDIGSTLGPRGFLDLKVKDPKGEFQKTEPLWTLLSPRSSSPEPFLLKPGQAERFPVSLLIMVPKEKRMSGTYKVKAVYTLKKKEYESAEVDVKWPGKK